MNSQPRGKRGPRQNVVPWSAAAAVAVMLLCCCGGLLDDEDEDASPVRPRVVATKTAAPVTSEPTVEPSPSGSSEPGESSEPEDGETVTSTRRANQAACVNRSKRSAAAVYFGEDYSSICPYAPDYDFGVSAKNYERCVNRSQKYHVEKAMYKSTCRYDHNYRWTEIDDPDYTYIPDVPDAARAPEAPAHSYIPDVPDYDSYEPGDMDDRAGTPSGGTDVGDGLHAGCTWVNSYHRKDGTHVRGHYRC